MRIYYARPRELMGTELDRANLKRLQAMYPGADIRIVSAKECRQNARMSKSMEPFFEIIDNVDLLAIGSSDPTSVPAGVFSEAQHALHQGKPVLALTPLGAKKVASLHPLKNAGKEKRQSNDWARMILK